MDVGKHDSDRVGARKAEAACSGMRDAAAANTRERVPSLTLSRPLSARETEATDTSASRATSRIVASTIGPRAPSEFRETDVRERLLLLLLRLM
jgi:hypothetical protein